MSKEETRISLLENNFINMMDKLDRFEEKLEEIKIQLTALPDSIFERADKRYASKLSEKVVYGMIGVLTTGVLVGILELLIRK